MAYWNTRGLRGSAFEEMINFTNEQYMRHGLATIQKIPTPITPTRLDKDTHTISEAYFNRQSTVDYIGAAQGVPICFDAKSTERKNLPLQNVHRHQLEFMSAFRGQRGLAFVLVQFQTTDEVFLLPFETLRDYWQAIPCGGRKSIPYSAFRRDLLVKNSGGFPVHYLEAVNVYLALKY
ncbi:MAG: Holliday junction resolvase RecU [Clostridiales bacterium]|jgi:recombination protein U|nr:Holliday junction resolvase RecU [Clostridiales bacterium]